MKSTAAGRVRNLLIAWVALSAMFMTVACNKNSGGGGKPGAGPAPAANPAVRGARGELDGTSGRPAMDRAHGGDKSKVGNVGTPEQSQDDRLPRSSRSVIRFDPTGMRPEEIFASSANLPETVIGPKCNISSGDGRELFYSGSGQDTLHEELKALIDRESDAAQRAADREFARELSLSHFEIDWQTRSVSLSFMTKRGGRRETVKTAGVLDNQLTFRAGDLSKPPYMAVEAACMDAKGGCHTVHMKVREAVNGKVRTAHILTRESSATLFIQGNGLGVAANEEYDRFMRILLNTVDYPGATNTVKNLSLSTSETINGQANFSIVMRLGLTSGEQSVAWTGPLVKAAGVDQLNVAVQSAPEVTTIDGQAVAMRGFISESIRETRLVRNDGRGNLQLEVTVRKATPESREDTLLLTIARIHKPVRSLVLR
jgi:hypothetical protein